MANAFACVIVGELQEAAYYFRVSAILNSDQDGIVLSARTSRIIAPNSNYNRIASVVENYRAAMSYVDPHGPKQNRLLHLTASTFHKGRSAVRKISRAPRVPPRDHTLHPFKAGLHAVCELRFGLAEKLFFQLLGGKSEISDSNFPIYVGLALTSAASGNYEQGRRYLSLASKCRKSARARLLASRLAQLPTPMVALDGRPLSSLTPEEKWEKYKCLWSEMDQFSALAEAGSLKSYVPKREVPR